MAESNEFQSRFTEFDDLRTGLVASRRKITDRIKVVEMELLGLQRALGKAVSLAENAQIGSLHIKINDATKRLSEITAQMAAAGGTNLQSAAKEDETSELHLLAEQAASVASSHLDGVIAVFDDALQQTQEIKKLYLKTLTKLGEAKRSLEDAKGQALLVNSFLPNEKSIAINSPAQSAILKDLIVNDFDVKMAYKHYLF